MENKYYGTVTTTYVVYADSAEKAYELLHEFPDGGENVNVRDQEFDVVDGEDY